MLTRGRSGYGVCARMPPLLSRTRLRGTWVRGNLARWIGVDCCIYLIFTAVRVDDVNDMSSLFLVIVDCPLQNSKGELIIAFFWEPSAKSG